MSQAPCQQTARATEVRHWGKEGENTHLGAWLETREGRVARVGGDATPQANGDRAVTILRKAAHGNRDNKISTCFYCLL